jgi:hypothetical protein
MASLPVMVYLVPRGRKFYTKEENTMGDRSPKAMQKQASQKKPNINSADQKRQQDLAAKALIAKGKNKK